jgi:hypothetical protein
MRLSVAAALFTLGCSASQAEAGRRGGGSGAAGPGAGGSAIDVSGGGPNVGGFGQGGGAGLGPGEECAVAQVEAELVSEPVDIIMVVDTSGSMREEAQAVEDNINVNFANILQSSGIDYRVILIARHRTAERATSGPNSTAICISSPLGGGACPSPAPIFSDRFFHFNEKIESDDSFQWIIDGYTRPDTETHLTANGYQGWLRAGVKKVFLEQTDDNSAMPLATFLEQLTAMAPQHFGSDPDNLSFVFHSITGLAQKNPATDPYLPDEPVVTQKCGAVTTAGEEYQLLSQRTGGLRFPICEYTGFDVVFRRIAEDVITRTRVACDFEIPSPPAGKTLDLNKVAVSHQKGDGSGTVQYLQAATPADCQADAFYIQDEHIYLCPDTCSVVQADPMAVVDVVFACESTIIVK